MTRDELRLHYQAMWDDAFPAIAGGTVADDPHLAGPDRRRGLTLIARPDAALQARFDALLDHLAALEPQQYRYPALDMHVTILPLFTATESPDAELARLAAYQAVVRTAVAGMAPFDIDFDGLALSRSAVLARGYPCGPGLAALRERLRAGLRDHGLDASVDQRYRLVTGHATLLRFAAPLVDPAGFSAQLAALRDVPLGTMHVTTMELVVNDWYMSHATLERIDVIPLTGPAAMGVVEPCGSH